MYLEAWSRPIIVQNKIDETTLPWFRAFAMAESDKPLGEHRRMKKINERSCICDIYDMPSFVLDIRA